MSKLGVAVTDLVTLLHRDVERMGLEGEDDSYSMMTSFYAKLFSWYGSSCLSYEYGLVRDGREGFPEMFWKRLGKMYLGIYDTMRFCTSRARGVGIYCGEEEVVGLELLCPSFLLAGKDEEHYMQETGLFLRYVKKGRLPLCGSEHEYLAFCCLILTYKIGGVGMMVDKFVSCTDGGKRKLLTSWIAKRMFQGLEHTEAGAEALSVGLMKMMNE